MRRFYSAHSLTNL